MAVALQPQLVGGRQERLQRMLRAQQVGEVFGISRGREPDQVFHRYSDSQEDRRTAAASRLAPPASLMTVSVTTTW